jgi:hypothetical protein
LKVQYVVACDPPIKLQRWDDCALLLFFDRAKFVVTRMLDDDSLFLIVGYKQTSIVIDGSSAERRGEANGSTGTDSTVTDVEVGSC